jgi:hypothetical protein
MAAPQSSNERRLIQLLGWKPPKSVAPTSFLRYAGFFYLKASLLLVAVAIGLYAWHEPIGGPSGGSWLGYTLGGVCTALMFWLMWFGVRKRRYDSRGAPLRGWLSAHVYLGLSLLVLVPLHSAFQFGWNVHTLAAALMGTVILSGLVGLIFYTEIPTPMTRNRPGQKLATLLEQIAEIDAQARSEAAGLPDAFAQAVVLSIEKTRIGGGLWTQLSGRDRSCANAAAVGRLEHLRESQGNRLDLQDSAKVGRLVGLLSAKRKLLARVRRDARYKALLDLWLLLHVPLSFATVAAVAVHVFVVFYYW